MASRSSPSRPRHIQACAPPRSSQNTRPVFPGRHRHLQAVHRHRRRLMLINYSQIFECITHCALTHFIHEKWGKGCGLFLYKEPSQSTEEIIDQSAYFSGMVAKKMCHKIYGEEDTCGMVRNRIAEQCGAPHESRDPVQERRHPARRRPCGDIATPPGPSRRIAGESQHENNIMRPSRTPCPRHLAITPAALYSPAVPSASPMRRRL